MSWLTLLAMELYSFPMDTDPLPTLLMVMEGKGFPDVLLSRTRTKVRRASLLSEEDMRDCNSATKEFVVDVKSY